MYLPSLTDDELLAYADTQELTPMESELVKRFEAFREETGDMNAEIDKLRVDLADSEEELDLLRADVATLAEELDELKGAV